MCVENTTKYLNNVKIIYDDFFNDSRWPFDLSGLNIRESVTNAAENINGLDAIFQNNYTGYGYTDLSLIFNSYSPIIAIDAEELMNYCIDNETVIPNGPLYNISLKNTDVTITYNDNLSGSNKKHDIKGKLFGDLFTNISLEDNNDLYENMEIIYNLNYTQELNNEKYNIIDLNKLHYKLSYYKDNIREFYEQSMPNDRIYIHEVDDNNHIEWYIDFTNITTHKGFYCPGDKDLYMYHKLFMRTNKLSQQGKLINFECKAHPIFYIIKWKENSKYHA